MDPEQHPIFPNTDALTPKKAILVVGKMGHGKSSFIRMLMEPRNDDSKFLEDGIGEVPVIKAGGVNGTSECSIYRVHPTHQLISDSQELYVIDTPGLNCDKSAFLIVEQADDLILVFKLQIVGIAYIIDISHREQNRNNQSYIGQFINLLKIRKQYRQHLFFPVCSQWDQFYDESESIQQFMSAFKQILERNNCSYMYEKIIKWASKRTTDFKKYLKFVKDKQGNEIVQAQWQKLSQTLQSQIPKIFPFDLYLQYYKKFWQSLTKFLTQKIQKKTKQFPFLKKTALFPINIKKQEKRIKQRNIMIPIVTNIILNVGRFSLAFAVSALALTNPIGITFVAVTGVVGIGITGYQLRQAFKKKMVLMEGNLEVNDQTAQQIRKNLQVNLHNKITNLLFQQLLEKLKKGDKSITIPPLSWLTQQIQAYYGKQLTPELQPFAKANKNNLKISCSKLHQTDEIDIILKTQVFLPKMGTEIEKVIREVMSKVYG